MLRLDKYLADVGIGSRSEVKKLLKFGFISINNNIVKDGSIKVNPDEDLITFKGKELFYQKYRYYMFNKPAGCVSATKDGLSQTVIEYLKGEPTRGLFPVGRLDKDTEGLLLITNDGILAHNLLSPKKHINKTYIAYVDKALNSQEIIEFQKGVNIGDETPTLPAEIKKAEDNDVSKSLSNSSIGINNLKYEAVYLVTLKEGRYHQIKRMFQHFNSNVVYLKRLSMGNLVLDNDILPGKFRQLSSDEINNLNNR